MSSKTRISNFVFPALLITSLLVVLVPLPPVVMDMLLAINIAVAVLVLLTTVFVESPMEFSVFPTVLLSATLGRLVLNVATTRLILTRAHHDGLSAAGGIVQGFGSFVAGDEIVVGLIIFAIIVLIQFLVVTKGATRISEVAARFALDGMPGRQMAVDADLNAGNITPAEAHNQREELRRSADFYGAMDGASKFVRGDAIAGLLITGINIVAGLFIGIVQGGMSPENATNLYTKLTIGDGLVSQVPAFLIALAAGLLITRSSERVNLPNEFLRQLLRRPEPLIVSAVFLGLLLFTHLPALPLLIVGGVMVTLAVMLSKTPDMFALPEEESPSVAHEEAKKEGGVEDLLAVDVLELEIGIGLLRLADPARGGDLLHRITALRKKVALELGVVMPRVRIRDNLKLAEYEYRFKIHGNVVADSVAYPLRMLATSENLEESPQNLDGVAVDHPVNGLPAWWIDPADHAAVTQQGLQTETAIEVVMDHLGATVRRNAADLLNRDATRKLIDQLKQHSPAVVAELLPDKLSLGQVQNVLQNLLREHVPIRNLPAILEGLCDAADQSNNLQNLTESVRLTLSRTISSALTNESGQMIVVTLNADWESRLMLMRRRIDKVDSTANLSGVPKLPGALTGVPATEQKLLIEDVGEAVRLIPRDRQQVLLIKSELRSFVQDLIADELPNVHVVSYAEINSSIEVRSAGFVGSLEVAA